MKKYIDRLREASMETLNRLLNENKNQIESLQRDGRMIQRVIEEKLMENHGENQIDNELDN